jgi:hypothetical protein
MRAAMMCLSVNLTPVTNLHHKDPQSAVLNVTNHPAIAHPVTPEISVRPDQCLARVAAYSIVQAKVTSHIGSGMDLFFPLTNTRKHIGSEVVVFHVLDAVFDDFAQVKSLGAPSLGCEVVKPLLGLWR